MKDYVHNIITQVKDKDNYGEYTREYALLIARVMYELNNRDIDECMSFATTYSLRKALKKFGQRAYESAGSEMGQLYNRRCFHPINIKALNAKEKKRAMDSLVFLVEK